MIILDHSTTLVSINQKYTTQRSTTRLILSNKYREFKKEIENMMAIQRTANKMNKVEEEIKDKIAMLIRLKTYSDIDNSVKTIIDAAAGIYNFNDRDIVHLSVYKQKVKHGEPSHLHVQMWSVS